MSTATLSSKQCQKREQILRAAERHFSDSRFDEVLMEDVAQRAGVGKGTIYRYFADKEALYAAVVSEGFSRLLDELRGSNEEADPVARLRRIVEAIVGFLSRNRPVSRLMGRDEGVDRRDHCREWKQRRGQLVDEVKAVLEQGAQSGFFDVRHPHTDAQILLGIVRSSLRANEGLSPEQITDETLRVFLHGVGVTPSE